MWNLKINLCQWNSICSLLVYHPVTGALILTIDLGYFPTATPQVSGHIATNTGCSRSSCILERFAWRIIPVSKWLVIPIYKPYRPFGKGTTLLRGLVNHGYSPLTNRVDPPSENRNFFHSHSITLLVFTVRCLEKVPKIGGLMVTYHGTK